MKIGIIAAMEEELRTLRERLEEQEETRYGQFRYYTGRLCGHDVALLLCGIGKVNAAVGATLLIDKFGPDYVINTGVAGGFPPDMLNVGDIVISTDVRHHDADATIFNYEYGQIPRMPAAYQADDRLRRLACRFLPKDSSIKVLEGQIMSGDSFIHQQKTDCRDSGEISLHYGGGNGRRGNRSKLLPLRRSFCHHPFDFRSGVD